MTLRRLLTWITFLAIFAMAARLSIEHDTWWHLRAGQWIVANRAVPQADPFSYTRFGAAWQYPGWLVEVPLYWIYKAFGPGGLNLWTAGMVTLSFAFVWRNLSGGPLLRAFVLVLAAAASALYWAARPYMVTFLLAAVYLWVLEGYRWRPSHKTARRLWLLPALMLVWANSHGGFLVGFLLLAAYLAGTLAPLFEAAGLAGWRAVFQTRVWPAAAPLLAMAGLMVVAVCLNPSGPRMLAYPFQTIQIAALQEYIQEWQPPDFQSLQVQPFIWLLLLSLAALGASPRSIALVDFLLLAGLAYMALTAGRNVALFALVAPMVITRHLEAPLAALQHRLGVRLQLDQPPTRLQSAMNTALLSLILLAAAVKAGLSLPAVENQAHLAGIFPVNAVSYLEEHRPEGRLFNSYNWGGYLLWALPEYPVFVDGRTDLYDDEIINQWLQVMRAQAGWQAILESYDVRLVLVEANSSLDRALSAAAPWQLLHRDALAVVYEKRNLK